MTTIDTPTTRVACLGAHIVDVLGRPVAHIPEGQGRQLLDEIRVTAAGTAAGTAVDLAKLGLDVVSLGAIGSDRLGEFLLAVLQDHGIDTRHLTRKDAVQTSATMLPIRPNGERPALHVPGATPLLVRGDIDLHDVGPVGAVHVGGADVLGHFAGDPLRDILVEARAAGAITTLDVLAPGDPDTWERLGPLLEHVTYFLPNEDQLRRLAGTDDLVEAAGAAIQRGVEAVLVSCGAAGCLLVTGREQWSIPAFDVEVVDTTGCGDAASAGFLTGVLAGWSLEDSAWLAMAAAALVVGGLGSDAGIVDLAGTIQLLERHAPPAVGDRVRSRAAASTGGSRGPELPDYDDLPAAPRGGRSGWGLFGADDSVGLLNLQTPSRVVAASRLIRTGQVFSLNARLDALDPPLYGRGAVEHTVLALGGRMAFDDKLDNFFPQASSQWDSLAHVGYGPDQFYNGATVDDVTSKARNTIDRWADRGIAGRAVLVDIDAALGGAGQGFDPASPRAITVEELDRARRQAGIEWEPGDVLLLHTGFLAWYGRQDHPVKEGLADPRRQATVGIEHSEEMARYLWDAHVAAVAGDNPAVEVWPPDMRPDRMPFGFLHNMLIGQFGLAIGELWWLDDLARSCRHDGRYTFFLTAAPINVAGGIGSPANALAIK
jgi:sugar/nucleoside kinase (ribokinase family)/kynurenine formamidase